MKSSIGESAITPQVINKVAPDVVSPQGKQELFTKQQTAVSQKPVLDILFKQIANKLGAQFSSRIKDPQTVVQKVASKRLEGRNYDLDNVGDYYGARIIGKTKDVKPIEEQMKAMALKIVKSQKIKNDGHEAYHVDFRTKQGTNGELQILTPQAELGSVATHQIKEQIGKDPTGNAKSIVKQIVSTAKQIPDDKAHAIAQALASMQQKQ